MSEAERIAQLEAEHHKLAAAHTALRKKYDALYTQSLEAARRRRKLEEAREEITRLKAENYELRCKVRDLNVDGRINPQAQAEQPSS